MRGTATRFGARLAAMPRLALQGGPTQPVAGFRVPYLHTTRGFATGRHNRDTRFEKTGNFEDVDGLRDMEMPFQEGEDRQVYRRPHLVDLAQSISILTRLHLICRSNPMLTCLGRLTFCPSQRIGERILLRWRGKKPSPEAKQKQSKRRRKLAGKCWCRLLRPSGTWRPDSA